MKTHSGRTNHWDNQSLVRCRKTGQEPARNIDIAKSYGGNDFINFNNFSDQVVVLKQKQSQHQPDAELTVTHSGEKICTDPNRNRNGKS